MSEQRVERRLAAILATDVASYSRLMGVNEEGTLAALKAIRRDVGDPMIAEHRGRIVKTTGDGLLVEFQSVVEAVRCAIEVQRAMAERNADMPPDKRIEFRIGIHQGDIIIDEGDIFGDGVNLAARLEALAHPGGICVSARVHEDVAGRIDASFEDLGEQSLKNINRSVRVYRIRSVAEQVVAAPAPPAQSLIGLQIRDSPSSAKTTRNIGFLATGPEPGYEDFRRALAAYGHIADETVSIHTRWSEGVNARFPALARELTELGVDLILAVAGPAVAAAKQATGTIPIVMVGIGDPVGYGIVPSLMRPGGNITGMSNALYEFVPRGVRLFKEFVPDAVRAVILAPHHDNPGSRLGAKSVEDTLHALGMVARTYNASTADDLRTICGALDRQNCDAIIVLPDHGLATHRSIILATAAALHVPVISALPSYVLEGALLSLGPNRHGVFRRAAYYVDAIFKGTPPSDLPIEEASKELTINLKTAKALGITIPATILMGADELIQ